MDTYREGKPTQPERLMNMAKATSKTTLTLILKGEYEFSGYYGITHIYKFADEEGKVYVWKTANVISLETENGNEYIYKGYKIILTGTIKEVQNYKGEEQTVLTRCKVTEIVSKVKSRAERIEDKKNEQLESLNDGDQVLEMSYKAYKEHYSDCETLAGSYEDGWIKVIVREGRLKPSGTRFQHYSYFTFVADGFKITVKAISEETARKQIKSKYPTDANRNWTLEGVNIYRQEGRHYRFY